MHESACCQGDVLAVVFLLVAHSCEAAAGAAVGRPVFLLLLPVVFVLRPWLARDLVSS